MADPTMVMGDDPACGIQKKLIHAGKGPEPQFKQYTKLLFKYVTRLCNEEKTVIDDNRNDSKPLELIIGKKFKLEVWETCLKSMRVGEVASFTCHEQLVASYPMVAKSLRDIRKGKTEQSGGCCGMMMQQMGLGYPDLDSLMKEPSKLEFILELVNVINEGEYEKDIWIMEEDEKQKSIPKLKEDGNNLYKSGSFKEAAQRYSEALGILENFILKEKPHETEWDALRQQKVPILLNYAMCKLKEDDYYTVIEHCSEVLKIQPDNVKALYRRAKAHVGAWNPSEARDDFRRASELDTSLSSAVAKELKEIERLEVEKNSADKSTYKDLFS